MIPDVNTRHHQEKPTACTPQVPGPAAERCPTCGRPYAPFCLTASGLLDLTLIAKEALADIQATLEEVMLP
jgi:hypothetical protein